MGWTNSLLTSLTLPQGATSGARIILINPATGDVMDIYNSLGQLIANIDPSGQYIVYQYDNITHAPIQHTQFGQEGLIYFSDVDNSDAIMEWVSSAAGNPSTQAAWTLQVANNNPSASNGVYTLMVFAGSDDGSHQPTMTGSERAITGSVVQSDQVSTNNLIHCTNISGTTNASGFLTFNHGASFTPSMIFCQVHDTGTPTFGMIDVINGSINATTAQVYCVQFGGGARMGAAVNFWIMCVG